MAGRFDASGKALWELGPMDWAGFLPGPAGTPLEAAVVDADIATIAGAADKVLRIRTRLGEFIRAVEFQAGPDAAVPGRAARNQILLHLRHRLPVEVLLLRLRPAAVLTAQDGRFAMTVPGDPEPCLVARYRVVDVWRLSAADLLAGPLAVLPLAPVSDLPVEEVPAALATIGRRLAAEATPSLAADLREMTKTLLELRFAEDTLRRLVMQLHEIPRPRVFKEFEDALEAKAELAASRRLIERMATRKYGKAAGKRVAAKLAAVESPAMFEDLAERLLTADSWEELTAELPAPPRATKPD